MKGPAQKICVTITTGTIAAETRRGDGRGMKGGNIIDTQERGQEDGLIHRQTSHRTKHKTTTGTLLLCLQRTGRERSRVCNKKLRAGKLLAKGRDRTCSSINRL